MTIRPIRKTFYLLPVINVTKNINPLSEAAKKSFDYDWKDFYTVEIGWLFWSIII